MRRSSAYGLIVALLLLAIAAPVGATVNPETNQVSYWCDDGVKYEPVDTPFVVPAPPEGTVWTLLVLKAGTTNETIANPVAGQSYAHSEHDNSHVILCWTEVVDTTTTSTTSTSSTTTSIPVDTTTTTKDGRSGTTTSSTSTTSSTTTTLTTTTEEPTTTVVVTVQCDEDEQEQNGKCVPILPNTGGPMALLGALGSLLAVLGGLTVWRTRSD